MQSTVTVELDWSKRGMPPEDQVIERAAELLVESAEGTTAKAVHEAVTETITRKVEEIIEAALATVFTPTNEFGEAKGRPLTMREFIGAEVKTYLDQRVNSQGKVSSYHGDNAVPRAQYYLREEARAIVDKMYRAEIDEAGRQIRKEMDDRIGQHLRQAVFQIAGIKELPKQLGA